MVTVITIRPKRKVGVDRSRSEFVSPWILDAAFKALSKIGPVSISTYYTDGKQSSRIDVSLHHSSSSMRAVKNQARKIRKVRSVGIYVDGHRARL